MYYLGIDVGSTTSKCALVDEGRRVVGKNLYVAGIGTDSAYKVIDEMLRILGLDATLVTYTVATGYGRKLFTKAQAEVSELTCHAKGVFNAFPNARTIIDIGGQDAKVMSLNEKGQMTNFLMNDKCAAGTGRFLDVMAGILKLDIGDLEKEYLKSENHVGISSTCTVFAESEVISQLASGKKREDVIAGICDSVAARVASLAKRIGIRKEVCMSGGVARNSGVRKSMEALLDVPILFSEDAQLMGAIGAAQLAWEKMHKSDEETKNRKSRYLIERQ